MSIFVDYRENINVLQNLIKNYDKYFDYQKKSNYDTSLDLLMKTNGEINSNEYIQRKTLEVGDYQLLNKESNKLYCIIERKSIEDLAQSLNNGKLFTEISQMNCFDVDKYLIIEGYIDDNTIVHGRSYISMMKSIYTLGIEIKRTKDINDTSREILQLLYKYNISTSHNFIDDAKVNETIKIYKKKIKSNINSYLLILSLVDKSTINTARAIMSIYPTSSDLIRSYDTHPDETIDKISELIPDGRKTKINKKLASNIIKSFIS